MTDVKFTMGEKLSEADQKKADPKEVGHMRSQPPKAEVEAEYIVRQICPYCGCVGYGDVSPYRFRYFTCHCCGGVFRM
jgi:hypothetical protein